MKKLISLISGLVLAFGIGAVSTSASEFLDYKPQIVYNAEATAIEDVRMTDGRVFIPLRAVFEMMGATVDYSNETTGITVVRDDTKVEFLREGTSMTITDLTGVNPVQVIDAEIRCDYNINRTFVPVRFISNALGARVGWDGETGSVYILDTYTLAQDFLKNTPKLAELLAKTATLDENVKSNADLSMSLSIETPESPAVTKADVKVNMTESEFDSKSTYGMKLDFTHENLESLTGGYKIGQLEGVTVDVLKNEEAIYFKTNAASKIKTFLPEEETLHLAEKVVTPDTWFRIDYSTVEERLGKSFADAIFKDEKIDPATFNADDVINDLMNAMTLIGDIESDVTYDEMSFVKGIFEAYKAIFSNITIEDAKDGSTTIKISFTLDDLLDIIPKSAFATEEEYYMTIQMIRAMLAFDLNASTTIANNIETSADASMKAGVELFGTKVNLEMKVSGTSEKLEKAPEFKAPEQSLSIETVMTLLDM